METDIQQAELSRLRLLIEEEEIKNKQYQMENIRRKHNYLPLIVEILKILAKEGQLLPLYEKAKERAMEKETKREEVKTWKPYYIAIQIRNSNTAGIVKFLFYPQII